MTAAMLISVVLWGVNLFAVVVGLTVDKEFRTDDRITLAMYATMLGFTSAVILMLLGKA